MIARFSYGHGPRHFLGFHGWGSEHRRSFSSVLEHMPEDVTFHAQDFPGCGDTPKPSDWSFDGVNQALAQDLDALPQDVRFTLVGSCSGSFHALEVASLRPERVEAIVLLEPFAFMPWFFSIFLTPVTGHLLYKLVFDNPIGQAMTRRSLARQKVHSDFDMVEAFGRSDQRVSYRYLEFYGALQDPTRWAHLDVPVRIVYGQNSWDAIHASVDIWRKNWPDLDAVELSGAGHMFSQENPADAARAIFASLA